MIDWKRKIEIELHPPIVIKIKWPNTAIWIGVEFFVALFSFLFGMLLGMATGIPVFIFGIMFFIAINFLIIGGYNIRNESY